MTFLKIKDDFNYSDRELKIIDFWKKNNIFEKSTENRSEEEIFVFYDGPPTANGKPHIGHILTRAIKDLIPRYKTMKGFKVLRKAGWDTHGLPVELEVEKKLNIDGKKEIENYGIEKFINECKKSVWIYKNLWEEISERIAFWVDMENPYITFDNNYIESVWWSLKKIFDMNLIYEGYKIVPYCMRCGTALSSHEVSQGYKNIKENSLIVKFKIKNKNEYFLAWTTTPWTLPSNVALVVNPNEIYAKVEYNDQVYIVGKNLVESIFFVNFKILEEFLGQNLIDIEYEMILDYARDFNFDKKNFKLICDDYVTLTDGTGVVHCAPSFGEDDARVGLKYGLEFFQPVDENGYFKNYMKEIKNIKIFDADKIIIEKLEKENKLFKKINHEHNYPHCWRCDQKLIYYARNSWFIAMTKIKEKLIKNNSLVNWYPENIKYGRFGNFLENVVDWSISRERYWGTPLNVWQCESCEYSHSIGSIDELKKMSNLSQEKIDNLDLHRPFIDKIILNCPKCGKKMIRVSEVIDCWFDSGSMPFAQFHYPFENRDIFEKNFPADFISEAVDQTRGWFYTLMAISSLVFDKPAYKNVLVLGHVLDKNGIKMSKHKNNVIDPKKILDDFGADVTRWYFYSNSSPWLPNKFDENDLNDIKKKFFSTLQNIYNFFALYANIDNFVADEKNLTLVNILDKWIISRFNNLIFCVDENLKNYKIFEATRKINDFIINDLSNWYIRVCRERFWVSNMPEDKLNAYKTLYKILLDISKLIAPFVPFVSEEIFKNLTNKESVHLENYPVVDKNLIDEKLERDMDVTKKIVELGRSARNKSNIKIRQPISKIFIKNNIYIESDYLKIILKELNIKKYEFFEDENIFLDYRIKLNLKTMGKKYGKYLNKITEFLDDCDKKNLIDGLNKKDLKLKIDKLEIILSKDDIFIEKTSKKNFSFANEKNIFVILDINLNEELIEEGFVREIISKIQNMRKELSFDVMDKIKIYHYGNLKLNDIFDKNIDLIKKETLAHEILNKKIDDASKKKFNINGEEIEVLLEKLKYN
ncbi:MAG: isoleucine--tRNA ligase [Clostridiales bacterium]|nr:isoleucine--tRNA ligase [Clostridiales bacterium]